MSRERLIIEEFKLQGYFVLDTMYYDGGSEWKVGQGYARERYEVCNKSLVTESAKRGFIVELARFMGVGGAILIMDNLEALGQERNGRIGTRMPEETKAAIIDLLKKGWPIYSIYKRTLISQNTIRSIKQRMGKVNRRAGRKVLLDIPAAKLGRCPECGAKCMLPCRACNLRNKISE